MDSCESSFISSSSTEFHKPQEFVTKLENIKVETMSTENENSWLVDIDKAPPSLQDEIQSLILDVQADEKFYSEATEFCKTLQILLAERFNTSVNVKLFGSAATHLALKDSDADYYLDFGNYPVSKNGLKNFFRKLRKENHLFENLQLIRAKVPIFKGVTHFGMHCDISFTKPFGVYKTDLINFFLGVNDSIRQLIVILKFWFKQQDLYGGDIGKIGGHSLISLLIFYLQQGKKPVLPSIYSLQMQCNVQEIIEGWVVSFAQNSTGISMKLSLVDNLINFFNFYSNFDFGKKIVSPFLGRAISKAHFCNARLIPSEFKCLKQNLVKDPTSLKKFQEGVMCVQDFIVHNRNVTKVVGKETMNKLQHDCLTAYRIFEKEGKLKTDDCGSCLFYKLFKPIYNPKDVSTEKFIEIPEHEGGNNCIFKNEPSEKTFRVIQIFLRINEDNKRFFTFLHNLLTRVMKCEVVIRDENNVKTYECKIDNRHILDQSYRKKVVRHCKILKKSFIEVAEYLNNPLFSTNQDIKPEINRSVFEIVCIVKDSPFRIECQFISKEGIESRRRILHQNLDGLVSVLMKWTGLKVS